MTKPKPKSMKAAKPNETPAPDPIALSPADVERISEAHARLGMIESQYGKQIREWIAARTAAKDVILEVFRARGLDPDLLDRHVWEKAIDGDSVVLRVSENGS